MHFVDREAKYPNRWTMKKSDGTSEVVTLVRNDEPIVEGTPMNAETLNSLSDVAGANIAKEEAIRQANNAAYSASAAFASEKKSSEYALKASDSQSLAKESQEKAEAAAELAGTRANTDKTLSVSDAPADAKIVGKKITQVDTALAGKLSASGGKMTGSIDFGDSSTGAHWVLANGDVYDLRPYSPGNVFQLTRSPADGTPAYGVLSVFENGNIEFARHSNKQSIVMATIEADGIHANLKGNADAALKLDGFDAQTGAQTWGVQIGTFVHGEDVDSGAFAFRKNCPASGQLSMVIDGKYYQNEGNYPCVDTSGADMTGYLNFGQTSTGLSWTCANGDIYHFRAYSPSSIFQLTRHNPGGLSEYGVFNVYSDGRVTTAFAGASEAVLNYGVVASGSNYLRFGDGTQICWGDGAAGTDTGNGQASGYVSFPVPFVNTSYAFTSSPNGDWQQNNRLGWTGTHDRGTTGTHVNSQGGNGGYYTWIAIGRWV